MTLLVPTRQMMPQRCDRERQSLGLGARAPDVDYRLEFHGRYSHGSAYIERLLAGVGLQAEIA